MMMIITNLDDSYIGEIGRTKYVSETRRFRVCFSMSYCLKILNKLFSVA